jgi:hypothetical protein
MGDVGVCMCECRARFLCVHYIVVVTLHKTATPASKRNKDGLSSPSRRKRLFLCTKCFITLLIFLQHAFPSFHSDFPYQKREVLCVELGGLLCS